MRFSNAQADQLTEAAKMLREGNLNPDVMQALAVLFDAAAAEHNETRGPIEVMTGRGDATTE